VGRGKREHCGKDVVREGVLWGGGRECCGKGEGAMWEGGGSIVGGRREEGGMWGGMERKGGSIFIASLAASPSPPGRSRAHARRSRTEGGEGLANFAVN